MAAARSVGVGAGVEKQANHVLVTIGYGCPVTEVGCRGTLREWTGLSAEGHPP